MATRHIVRTAARQAWRPQQGGSRCAMPSSLGRWITGVRHGGPEDREEGVLGKIKGAVLDHLRPDEHTRGRAYRDAERTAREVLELQMKDGADCPGTVEMQLEEGQEVPHSVTGARSWNQNNAQPAATKPLRKADLE